mmetsp:Transcript_75963/g.127683  ORF Transcript_75963/g.127683 Transcript_75963/m.127683 type:complete len:82 (-) Transcript_75963:462-707(-)
MMTSQFLMVESRWATINTVILSVMMISSRAACTSCSLVLSSALVASSSSNNVGLRIMHRAMATRCFWPPLSCEPFAPTFVS